MNHCFYVKYCNIYAKQYFHIYIRIRTNNVFFPNIFLFYITLYFLFIGLCEYPFKSQNTIIFTSLSVILKFCSSSILLFSFQVMLNGAVIQRLEFVNLSIFSLYVVIISVGIDKALILSHDIAHEIKWRCSQFSILSPTGGPTLVQTFDPIIFRNFHSSENSFSSIGSMNNIFCSTDHLLWLTEYCS